MKNKLIILASILAMPVIIASCGKNTETMKGTETQAENISKNPAVEVDKEAPTFEVSDSLGNTLTIEHQTEIVTDPDKYSATTYPLIASLPENDIYVYEDKNKGMIYVENGYAEYFPIGAVMTPIMVFPQIFYSDFDGNGDDEVTIIFNTSGGTDVYLEDIYLIEEIEKDNLPYFEAIAITQPKIDSYLKKDISYTKASDNLMKLTVAGTEYDVPIIDKVTELSYGNIEYFDIIGTDIRLHIPVGVIQEGTVTAQYENMGEILYKVQYVNEELVLADPTFVTTNLE